MSSSINDLTGSMISNKVVPIKAL